MHSFPRGLKPPPPSKSSPLLRPDRVPPSPCLPTKNQIEFHPLQWSRAEKKDLIKAFYRLKLENDAPFAFALAVVRPKWTSKKSPPPSQRGGGENYAMPWHFLNFKIGHGFAKWIRNSVYWYTGTWTDIFILLKNYR